MIVKVESCFGIKKLCIILNFGNSVLYTFESHTIKLILNIVFVQIETHHKYAQAY